MYNQRYEVESYGQLDKLTEVADFFCALPVISATIIGASVMSPMLRHDEECGSGFSRSAIWIVECARKIRNPILFREAFIETVSQWEGLKINAYLGFQTRRKRIHTDI